MINNIFLMNEYAIYVWAAFSFTLISFTTLYVIIKTQLVEQQSKFVLKFGSLTKEKAKIAKTQNANKELLVYIANTNI